MRYLVLTDIHANLEALEACLSDARARGYDETLVLGDIVGYGPDPDAVVERVQALRPLAIVRGNHDKIALGMDQAKGFHAIARAAARWTLDTLTPDHRQWLAALPEGPCTVDELVEICHGSPFDEDAYIVDEFEALKAINTAAAPLCLYGHTHFGVAFQLANGVLEITRLAGSGRTELLLRGGVKYLVNPGAVGQPRDGDPRAAYAIVDTAARRIELVRVAYPFDVTRDKVLKAGLPDMLARRLAVGR
jgi:diadenosine tetraphosphatase ApaH/serine/threonine PP2A family protein phosphatase